MTMEHGESRLRQLGDADLAEMQSTLHRIFRERHPDMEDIALPSQVVSPVEQLTAIEKATVPADLTQALETRLPTQTSRLTIATFRDQLSEGFRARGQEIALPEPSPEIVEVYNILTGEGYDVAPIAYVDGKNKEVRIGVFETVARPDYTDGTQMYYSPRKDPLAGVLLQGREGKKIAVPDFVRHVPVNSRFAVSWDEIHNYVVPEAIKTTSHLAQQLKKGGITLDIPNLADFRSAGQEHEDKLVANSWEWVQDSARFGRRLLAGGRAYGGLVAVLGWLSGRRFGCFAFRLQAVSPSQPLPR